MSEELTTRPMLEAILEGQRHIVSQLVALHTVGDSVSAKVDQIATRQNELAEKQDDLVGRQERLELRMAELGREVVTGSTIPTVPSKYSISECLPLNCG